MWVQIDPLSPEPLFRQVCSAIKAAVARGRLKEGERLPSVRELAHELAINPNTVAKAYGELEHEGVIVKRQGAGCFVKGGDGLRSDQSRRLELTKLAEHLAIEAFHLGLDGVDVRAALEQALALLPAVDRSAPQGSASGRPLAENSGENTNLSSMPRSTEPPDAERRAS